MGSKQYASSLGLAVPKPHRNSAARFAMSLFVFPVIAMSIDDIESNMSCNSGSVSSTDTAAALRMMQHRHGVTKQLSDAIMSDDVVTSDSRRRACRYMNGASKKAFNAHNPQPNKLITKCETCKSQGKQNLLNKWCKGWLDIPCEAEMIMCVHTPGTTQQAEIDAGNLYLLLSDDCVQAGGSAYEEQDLDWGSCLEACRTSEDCNSLIYEETCSNMASKCYNHCKMYEELPDSSAFDTTSRNRWYVSVKKETMTYPNGQKPEC